MTSNDTEKLSKRVAFKTNIIFRDSLVPQWLRGYSISVYSEKRSKRLTCNQQVARSIRAWGSIIFLDILCDDDPVDNK